MSVFFHYLQELLTDDSPVIPDLDDPRTDEERAADEDWQDQQITQNAVRPGGM